MKLSKRIYITLALLLGGGANLLAELPEIEVPFPGFNFRKWPNFAIIEGQFYQNGEIVKNGTAAIYTDKYELRGVKPVNNSGMYFGKAYGNYDNEVITYLHFKVYTNGRFYTCYPKPDLTWEDIMTENDQIIGNDNPYIIDITPDSLKDVIDNTSLLANLGNGKWPTTIVLPNREINNEWNTLALPFDVSEVQLTETFGEGWSLYEFYDSKLNDGMLSLEFKKATCMEAGKPYFIKVSDEVGCVENPVFADVRVNPLANAPTRTGLVDFYPTLNPSQLVGTNIHDFLILGGGNTLFHPATLDNAWMKGFRGFFQVHDLPDASAAQFRLVFESEEEVSGILGAGIDLNQENRTFYNLMGQPLRERPAQRGFYIQNHKKIIIK
ncbi:MAG: hypothetical protein IJS20_00080 [Bacteroidales bacterium]|nr:hypothetical protein [Bacteroidales bacterium]